MTQPVDSFDNALDGVSSPARRAFAIVPHATQPLAQLPKALLVGAAGTIALRAVDSEADVTIAVVAGQLVPIRASHVRAAGTTATQIVGLA